MSSTGCPSECVKQHCMTHIEGQQNGCKEHDWELPCVTGSDRGLEKNWFAPEL